MKQTITRILPYWHQDCGLIDTRNPNVFKWAKVEKDDELLYIADQINDGNASIKTGFKKINHSKTDSDWELLVEVSWNKVEDYMLAKLKLGTQL